MSAAKTSSSLSRRFLPLAPRPFLLILLTGVLLRLLFFIRFPEFVTDSMVYGDIAKNWLLHGVYGFTGSTGPVPTLIRLPGYPAFLAAVFAIFGVEHYNAVYYIQIAFDMGTCWLIADLARRTVSKSAGGIAFALSALCPFLANYAAAVLTETLATFFAALALDLAVAAFDAEGSGGLRRWAGCGAAIAAGILLRPDGGIMLVAIGSALLWRFIRQPGMRRQTLAAGAVMLLVVLAPLVPWTWRNWRTFHVFQPLAPEGANDPGEHEPLGFIRWERTWMVDYASKFDISFRAETETMDVNLLPARAFDSDDEHRLTEQLFAEYNADINITPELDAKFGALAAQRVRRHLLRYYVWLPILRALNLWFRPRTEMLPVSEHFLEALDDPPEAVLTLGFLLLNLWYVAAALVGFLGRRVRYLGLLAGFCVLRTVIIAVITLPEPRYVLECYPVVLVLAAASISAWFTPKPARPVTVRMVAD
jgi:4-amino-4-deoxy-L-arabinose transferase-like glycosyltransferase